MTTYRNNYNVRLGSRLRGTQPPEKHWQLDPWQDKDIHLIKNKLKGSLISHNSDDLALNI